jgi:hypothetical protein
LIPLLIFFRSRVIAPQIRWRAKRYGTRQLLPGALLINGTEILLGALGSGANIADQ